MLHMISGIVAIGFLIGTFVDKVPMVFAEYMGINYYVFIRWVVCGCAVIWVFHKNKQLEGVKIVLFVFAVLYNPIMPFALGKNLWQLVNVATIVAFMYGMWLEYTARQNIDNGTQQDSAPLQVNSKVQKTVINLSPPPIKDYPRRFKTKYGERVRSHVEKMIANYLYDRGIDHIYEEPFACRNKYDYDYCPDFSIPSISAYIEYFGMDSEEYDTAKEWKLELHRTYGTNLIDLYWTDYKAGDLLHKLTLKLDKAGINNVADVNMPNQRGSTPLIMAVLGNELGRVKVLIDGGADVNMQDNKRFTALMYAVRQDAPNPDIVKVLIDKGADVNRTVLRLASDKNNPYIIKILKNAGAK